MKIAILTIALCLVQASGNCAPIITAKQCQNIKSSPSPQAFIYSQQKLWQEQAIPVGEYDIEVGKNIKGAEELILILKPGTNYYAKGESDNVSFIEMNEVKADCPGTRQYRLKWSSRPEFLAKTGPFTIDLPIQIDAPEEGPLMNSKFKVQGMLHAPVLLKTLKQEEALPFMQGQRQQFNIPFKNGGDRPLLIQNPYLLEEKTTLPFKISKHDCKGSYEPGQGCVVTLERTNMQSVSEFTISLESNSLGAQGVRAYFYYGDKNIIKVSYKGD